MRSESERAVTVWRILTILMKAERKTTMMVKTPTSVLFSLDRTILLERVCRGTGKSWEKETQSEDVSGTEKKVLWLLLWNCFVNFHIIPES